MANIGDDSPVTFRKKLEAKHARKYPDFQIVDYQQVDHSYGLTAISFNEYMRKATHGFYFPLLPATLLMDGLIRKGQKKRVHYFHTERGVYLGSSENEAINRANEIGEQMMESQKYSIGRSFFNIAYNLCRSTNDARSGTFTDKMEKAEREVRKLEKEREVREEARRQEEREQKARDEAIEQKAREEAIEQRAKEAREREAKEQEERTQLKREQEAREQEVREREKKIQEAIKEEERKEEVRTEWRAMRERMKLEADKRVAKNSFEQGQQLWSKTFSLENSGKGTDAKSMFETCVNLLTKAASLEPANEQYSNWHKAMQLKQQEHPCFMDGYTLQEQGTQFFQQEKYKEALDMYEKARQKYNKGFELSRDSRFEACVKNVERLTSSAKREESKLLLKETIAEQEISSDSEQSCSLQSGNYDVHEVSGNFMFVK